jgi:nucleoid-associated protein YgaU
MKLLTRAVPLSVLLFSASLPSAGTAQTAAPAGGELRTGWHIVRPGDTLRGIAHRYAGSQELWQRLRELNPGIADPDVIEPGQRIQVLLKPDPSSPSGQLRRLSQIGRAHV